MLAERSRVEMKKVHFLTSNRAKMMHARHLASNFGIEILGKRSYGKAYREPRIRNRERLLRQSYQDALDRWNKSGGDKYSLFFIEDTSVTIEALSGKREVPGLDIKYWMREMTFAQLDKQLKAHGNNRKAVVRSDVILHLSDELRERLNTKHSFLRFTGEQTGYVTDTECQITTSLLYPWLDSRSFNKWFVPLGADCPLSCLPIEEAEKYDFRRNSIGDMLRFLHDNDVLDTPENLAAETQKFFPSFFPPIIIISGLPCAGKSTLGAHLSENYGYLHVEASDYMKCAFYERHGRDSTLSIHDFAEQALLVNPSVVVLPLSKDLERLKVEAVVITGLRSPREISIFRERYKGHSEIVCLYVDADREIRFKRSELRARKDSASSIDDFERRDALQLGMGLRDIRMEAANNIVENTKSKKHFFNKSVSILKIEGYKKAPLKSKSSRRRPTSLEEAILLCLWMDSCDKPRTTTEIATLMAKRFEEGVETNKNNVSRYFNFRSSPFYSIDTSDGVLRYSLSATGKSRALLLHRIASG